jgi:hypothetical protein
LERLSKLSPEAATLSLEAHARHRQLCPTSRYTSNRAVAAPALNASAARVALELLANDSPAQATISSLSP